MVLVTACTLEGMEFQKAFLKSREYALDWASNKHAEGGQVYNVGQPYAAHLLAVEEVLLRHGFTDPQNPIHQTLRLAALMHDLMEDTPVRIETIRVLYGVDVARLVDAVSNRPGPNRAARHAECYPRIRATPWATPLKLADRIVNWGVSQMDSTPQLGMYQREWPNFRAALWNPEGVDHIPSMWEELENLGECASAQGEMPIMIAPPTTSEPTQSFNLPEAPWIV